MKLKHWNAIGTLAWKLRHCTFGRLEKWLSKKQHEALAREKKR